LGDTDRELHRMASLGQIRLPSVRRLRATFRARLHSLPLLEMVFPGAYLIDFIIDKPFLMEAEFERICCDGVNSGNRCSDFEGICHRAKKLAALGRQYAKATSVLLPIKRPENTGDA